MPTYDQDLVRMHVKALIVDPKSNVPIILLRDEELTRILPIWIGVYEANAIALQLEGVEPPRPLTHDLAMRLIETLDARIVRIIVNDLTDNTFFAKIFLDGQGGERVIDSRPSDAIALALRAQAPIYVANTVLDRASQDENADRLRDEERLKKLLEELDPEDLGKYTM